MEGIDFEKANSVLLITTVEEIQNTANQSVEELAGKGIPGIYICINRPHVAVRKSLESAGISVDKVFFVDCMSTQPGAGEKAENVLHIQSPADLTGLNIAITEFSEKISGRKFLVIDALTALLIYNTEDIIVKFVKSVLEHAQKSDIKTVFLTTEPRGGDLITKVSLLFDKIVNYHHQNPKQ